MPETNGDNENGGVEIECPTPEVDELKSLHEVNLEVAQAMLSSYEEQHASKLFKGVHLRYFTKEELIKVLDITWNVIMEGGK